MVHLRGRGPSWSRRLDDSSTNVLKVGELMGIGCVFVLVIGDLRGANWTWMMC